DNLGREGVPVHPSFLPSPERPAAFLTGDVMLDNQRYFLERLDETAPAQQLQGQVLATLHRETVTADPSGLRAFARALLDIAEEGIPVVLPLHPRTRNSFAALGLDHEMEALAKHPRIRLSGPLTYLELLPVLRGCSMVMTDSGGLQKEAYFLGKPVVILRERTEWEEIVASGWGVTTPIDAASILEARRRLLGAPLPGRPAFFGDGHAAEKIRDLILEYL
ncbi:MAG TPA: UDP-N-acetylglucosamine 2-epimerase, partial [Bacteroidales bacterium]|nr:UDP-N-acetylglucosamine 2-epimerase [Bacteroidales bacterium]